MLRVNWIQAHTTHKPTYIWTNRTLIETEKQKTKNLNLEKIDEHNSDTNEETISYSAPLKWLLFFTKSAK